MSCSEPSGDVDNTRPDHVETCLGSRVGVVVASFIVTGDGAILHVFFGGVPLDLAKGDAVWAFCAQEFEEHVFKVSVGLEAPRLRIVPLAVIL